MNRAKQVVGIDYAIANMPAPERKITIRDKQLEKRKAAEDSDKKAQGLFKYFCVALICMVVLLGQGVYISSQGVEIGKVNGLIDEYKLQNDKNIIKISNLSSLEHIESTAINEYNMMRPEQVQYLRR